MTAATAGTNGRRPPSEASFLPQLQRDRQLGDPLLLGCDGDGTVALRGGDVDLNLLTRGRRVQEAGARRR